MRMVPVPSGAFGRSVAFCDTGRCSDGKAALLLRNERGQAFGREILPLVADPVMVRGRIVEVAGLRQVRVKLSDIVRI